MAMNLLLDDYKRVAERPNGLDPDVLMAMQRNLFSQVMQLYREDYAAFNKQLEARRLTPEQCRVERTALLTQLLQTEYRHRSSNGQGFSVAQYVDAAADHYGMEITRLAQSLSDYVVVARHAAENHYMEGMRDIHRAEPGTRDLANRMAEQLDRLESAMDGLSRVARSATAVQSLREQLGRVFEDARKDSFANAVLGEAQTLAAARQFERKHGLSDEAGPRLHGMA